MNNRYLYRAKRIDNGELVEGFYAVIGEKTVIIEKEREEFYDVEGDKKSNGNKIVEVDPSTICQCTGLKDKNGKLIWENDIVKKHFYTDYDNYANSEEYIGFVKYEDCAWVIKTKRDNGICTRPIIESMAYSDDIKHFEVIGNRFDNPELLEVGE